MKLPQDCDLCHGHAPANLTRALQDDECTIDTGEKRTVSQQATMEARNGKHAGLTLSC